MSKQKGLTLRILLFIMCAALMLATAGCTPKDNKAALLDPNNPVTVTIWNYYNGDQLAAFEQLMEDFNSTVGAEKGVVVLNVSQGDINTLADSLIASVEGKAGAQEKPMLAAVYAETAYILDQVGALEPLDSYFTKEELDAYVPGFLSEGRFNKNNDLLLFPILKSSELFTANQTDWQPFADATGITLDGLKTKEDLTAAAKAYYEWTDAQTPEVPEDGKALYGRDSVANYVYVGCNQLGHELFKVVDGKLTVDMDRATFKTLWDHYYIPFINGYFGAYAKFRSEDCKTGKILALTSSSSSVGYLPTAVTMADDTTHDIDTYEAGDLPFAGAVNKAVVQQGANYCLLRSTPAQQAGAVEFIKWFTQPERNLSFALMSGYSPVTLASNTKDAITAAYTGDTTSKKGQNVLGALTVCADLFSNSTPYATKPFKGSKEVRSILGDMLEDRAVEDRAAVAEAIAAGATREQAVAPYMTDAYFDAWFNTLLEQVNKATQQ